MKRGRLVSFRLNEQEYEALHAMSCKSGTNVSDFTRILIFEALGKGHLEEHLRRDVEEFEERTRSLLLQIRLLAADVSNRQHH